MRYERMVIGEAINNEYLTNVAEIMKVNCHERLINEPGFESYSIIKEDGGHMIILQTVWMSREDCVRYHSGRAYRQLVASTQHMLVGDFVVKLFKVVETGTPTERRAGSAFVAI